MNWRRIIWIGALSLAGLLATGGGAAAQELADYDYENLSFRGVGLDYGYLWPNKVEATPVYGVRVDLGFLGPGVRLVPSASYWSSPVKTVELTRLADQISRLEALQQQGIQVSAEDLGTIEWSSLSLGLDGHYVWDTDLGIQTFLGAGVGLHAMNGSGAAIENTFIEDLLDTVTAGVAAIGGIEFEPVRNLRLVGEARYTLLSDVRYPGLRIGAAYTLPLAGTGVRR